MIARRILRLAAFLAALAVVLPVMPAASQIGADLNISPKRVVFGGSDRSATVYVFNQGDQPATYSIEMIDRAMLTDGKIVTTDPKSPSASSALPLLEYTPHLITLAPKTSQSVRIRMRRPSTPGEYRSHLTVTAQPPEDVGFTATAAAANDDPSALAVRVVALFSISIPVIVREGAIDASATIEHATVVPGRVSGSVQTIALDLVRRGTGSVYGNIEAYVGKGRAEQRVGFIRGVAVYPDIERRPFSLPLTKAIASGERIRLVYRDDDGQPGVELTEVSLVVP